MTTASASRLGELTRKVEALPGGAVAVGEKPADRPVVFFRDALGRGVDDAFARVDEQDWAGNQG